MKILWASALLLTACVETGQATTTDWVLASVDGIAVDYTATLSLAERGRVSGQAPCNRYFADVTRDGATFIFGMIGATRRACLQIHGEATFFQTLQGVDTAEEASGSLTLSGAGHQMKFLPAQE